MGTFFSYISATLLDGQFDVKRGAATQFGVANVFKNGSSRNGRKSSETD